MIVKKTGTYRTLEPIKMSGPNSSGTVGRGLLITISQVDVKREKVTGPIFPDWMDWDLPVVNVEESEI